MHGHHTRVALAAALAMLLLAAPAQADFVSRFDTGTDGWTATQGGALTFQAAGGNPGGHGEFRADGQPGVTQAISPEAWDGDRRSAIGRRLMFDLRVPSVDPSLRTPLVYVAGANGTAAVEYRATVTPAPGWQHFEVPLSPGSGWTRPDGQAATATDFEQALGSLNVIQLLMEHDQQNGVFGLDNVVLEADQPTPGAAVAREGNELVLRAGSDDAHRIDVIVTAADGMARFSGTGAGGRRIGPGAGCTPGPGQPGSGMAVDAACSTTGITGIRILTAGGKDDVGVRGTLPFTVELGAGDDTFRVNPADIPATTTPCRAAIRCGSPSTAEPGTTGST